MNSRVRTNREDLASVSKYVNAYGRPLEILEAGCGRKWAVDINVPYRLTGIDTDADALSARMEKMRDLDAAVVGDLRTADLPPEGYDVIYCSFVLEHVRGAEQVLMNFARWLKPGGMLIVRVPDRDTVFGCITRVTPHWLHIGYYRYVLGIKAAGTPGHGPYPTHYDPVISRRGMNRFCSENELSLVETHLVDSWIKNSNARKIFIASLSWLTLGFLPWRWNNVTFVVRKSTHPGLDNASTAVA